MEHEADPSFWNAYYDLPRWVQDLAEKKRDLMFEDPKLVSLEKKNGYWTARINRNYRAVGIDIPDPDTYGVLWIWVGDHDDYDRLING